MSISRGCYIFLCMVMLGGCDSSYHAYDGRSGFSIQAVKPQAFHINYYGNTANTQQDVLTMWHHAAREQCKGGTYAHEITNMEPLSNAKLIWREGTIIPKNNAGHLIQGEVQCLIGDLGSLAHYAKKSVNSDLSANHFVSGRPSH